MDFTEINGAGLRYEVSGSGSRPLVLLHEMAGSLESFDEILPMLAPGRRILRYDWRGAGMAERVTGTLSIETLTDDLFALLDAVGLRGKVALCGAAVGSAIALNAAARDSSRIGAVIAMSPSVGIPADRRAGALAGADDVERRGMRPQAPASMEAVYPQVLRNDEAQFRRYFARWLGVDPQSYAAAFRMLANLDMNEALGRVACPVLVLAGEFDPIRPLAVAKAVADRLPQSQLRLLPSGHVMATQTPRLVADAAHAFLDPLGL